MAILSFNLYKKYGRWVTRSEEDEEKTTPKFFLKGTPQHADAFIHAFPTQWRPYHSNNTNNNNEDEMTSW